MKLDSNITPCAEQALVQIEAALTASHYCLCYQYATPNLSMLGYTGAAAGALVATDDTIVRTVVERTTTFGFLDPAVAPTLGGTPP